MEMTNVAPTVSALLGVRYPASTQGEPLKDVVDGLGRVERLAMVVIDALGVATWKALQSASPNINELAGRRLLALRSVSPPITPVNFATMATGAPPEAHCLRQRTDELQLETIFDVLREAGRSTATASRARSTVGVLLAPFADRAWIAASNEDEEVLRLATEALRDRPEFLLVHFLDVDDAGHAFGPLSPQSRQAVAESDRRLGELTGAMVSHGYSLLLLADHGQHEVEPEDREVKYRGTHNGRVEADFLVPVTWATAAELSKASVSKLL